MIYEEIIKPITQGETWGEEERAWSQMDFAWNYNGYESIPKPSLPVVKWDVGFWDVGFWDELKEAYDVIFDVDLPTIQWDEGYWDSFNNWDEKSYNEIIKPTL